MIVLKVLAPAMFAYFNLVVSVAMVVAVYFHPLTTFKMEAITRYASAVLIATMVLSSLYSIFSLRMATVGDLLFFIGVNGVGGYMLAQFMFTRIVNVLKSKTKMKDKLSTIEGQD